MTRSPRARTLISVDELAGLLGQPGVAIVDASWHMPAAGRNPAADFAAGHIPGAVFLDIDALSDPSSGLPHMLPTADVAGAALGALGLADTDTLIVYDSVGLFSAARGWWTLKVFGAKDVRVLDGGLPAWIAAGQPLETGPATARPKTFHATKPGAAVADFSRVLAVLADGSAQVADARAGERFRGEVAEPRAGLRAGHMPGAKNVPFQTLLEEGRLKDATGLADTFAAAGIDVARPVITSCGSGVTAAVLTLALATLGAEGGALYDGSWTEWGGRPELPVVTGA